MHTRNATPEARTNCLIIGTILFVMILIGAALVFTMSRDVVPEKKWRIAINNWPGFDLVYLASAKGFFRQNGLNIELVPINSLTDMRTAFERGAIDGFTGTLMDVVESIQNNRTPSRIVLVVDYSNGDDMILTDPSITTIAELRGKRISMEITSPISRYMLERSLEGSGLTTADLDIRPYSQTILVDQAIRGNLDAVITYEPFASRIQQQRPMTQLFDSSHIPEEIIDVLTVTPAMLEAEPNLSQRLQLAWQSAIDYTESHPDETTALFAERYQVTPQAYKALSEGIHIFSRTEMQRFSSRHALHQAIWRISQVLNPQLPLAAAEISRTVAVWYQKEAH